MNIATVAAYTASAGFLVNGIYQHITGSENTISHVTSYSVVPLFMGMGIVSQVVTQIYRGSIEDERNLNRRETINPSALENTIE